MRPSTRTVALAAVLLSPVLTSAAADRRTPAATQAAATYAYQGTVHAVDPKTSSLDLITGVGMALRLVHMRALPTTPVTAGGAPIPLAALKPGDVVRADCHRTEAGLVADKIEKLAGEGGAR